MLVSGLILAGGKSKRMGNEKAQLNYHGQDQISYLNGLINNIDLKSYISINKNQATDIASNLERIIDEKENIGPIGGLYSAFNYNSKTAWLVVACDLPYLKENDILKLIKHRNQDSIATCYKNVMTNRVEPMISIWEPKAFSFIKSSISKKEYSLSKILNSTLVNQVDLSDSKLFTNVNTKADFKIVKEALGKSNKL